MKDQTITLPDQTNPKTDSDHNRSEHMHINNKETGKSPLETKRDCRKAEPVSSSPPEEAEDLKDSEKSESAPANRLWKAVWIDVDDTMLDFRASSALAMEKACRHFQIPFLSEYGEIFLRVNDGFWHRLEKKEITMEQLRSQRWPVVFEQCGWTGTVPDTFDAQFRREMYTSAVRADHVEQALKQLASSYPLFVISNAPLEEQISRLKTSGLDGYFQEFYVSEQLKAAKPDPLFFEKALDLCRKSLKDPTLQPQEILVIGDSWRADIAGAARFGTDALWFDLKQAKAVPETAAQEFPGTITPVCGWKETADFVLRKNKLPEQA